MNTNMIAINNDITQQVTEQLQSTKTEHRNNKQKTIIYYYGKRNNKEQSNRNVQT